MTRCGSGEQQDVALFVRLYQIGAPVQVRGAGDVAGGVDAPPGTVRSPARIQNLEAGPGDVLGQPFGRRQQFRPPVSKSSQLDPPRETEPHVAASIIGSDGWSFHARRREAARDPGGATGHVRGHLPQHRFGGAAAARDGSGDGRIGGNRTSNRPGRRRLLEGFGRAHGRGPGRRSRRARNRTAPDGADPRHDRRHERRDMGDRLAGRRQGGHDLARARRRAWAAVGAARPPRRGPGHRRHRHRRRSGAGPRGPGSGARTEHSARLPFARLVGHRRPAPHRRDRRPGPFARCACRGRRRAVGRRDPGFGRGTGRGFLRRPRPEVAARPRRHRRPVLRVGGLRSAARDLRRLRQLRIRSTWPPRASSGRTPGGSKSPASTSPPCSVSPEARPGCRCTSG